MTRRKKNKILLIMAICLFTATALLWGYAIGIIIKAKSIFSLSRPSLFFLSLIMGGFFAMIANLFLYIRLKSIEKQESRRRNLTICSVCGSKIRKSDAFCPKCGAEIKKENFLQDHSEKNNEKA